VRCLTGIYGIFFFFLCHWPSTGSSVGVGRSGRAPCVVGVGVSASASARRSAAALGRAYVGLPAAPLASLVRQAPPAEAPPPQRATRNAARKTRNAYVHVQHQSTT
jgi:hypothetical protein